MKRTLIALQILLFCASAAAAQNSTTASSFPEDYSEAKPPPAGKEIRKYADDQGSGPAANFGVVPVHDNQIFAMVQADRFEYQARDGSDLLLWDMQAWIGGDYNKLYLESEGEYLLDPEEFEEIGLELFYGRNIASFWDLRAGFRHDFKPDPDRTFAAFGVQGMAPYEFEIDATAYLSEDGDISAALEAEYHILFSQRLILQPRLELSAAVQEVEEYGVGQGFNSIELGLRLRYEISRKFAPYIGIAWSKKLGETADFAEAEGEDTDVFSTIAGIGWWF